MISVISCTNRDGRTKIVSKFIEQTLLREGVEAQLLTLDEVEYDFILPTMYDSDIIHRGLIAIQDQYFLRPEKWIFVIPEYNGGIPGIFKTLIDAMSVRKLEQTFHGKKVALVGISSGRSGNIRGLDYTGNFLHYLGSRIVCKKLPISQMEENINKNGIIKQDTQDAIKTLLKNFVQK